MDSNRGLSLRGTLRAGKLQVSGEGENREPKPCGCLGEAEMEVSRPGHAAEGKLPNKQGSPDRALVKDSNSILQFWPASERNRQKKERVPPCE